MSGLVESITSTDWMVLAVIGLAIVLAVVSAGQSAQASRRRRRRR